MLQISMKKLGLTTMTPGRGAIPRIARPEEVAFLITLNLVLIRPFSELNIERGNARSAGSLATRADYSRRQHHTDSAYRDG
jgi:hypothetical protein